MLRISVLFGAWIVNDDKNHGFVTARSRSGLSDFKRARAGERMRTPASIDRSRRELSSGPQKARPARSSPAYRHLGSRLGQGRVRKAGKNIWPGFERQRESRWAVAHAH